MIILAYGIVDHITCVCVCVSWRVYSLVDLIFATASCRFLILLSLLFPQGLPVCVRAEKRFLALLLVQSGLHSGQNRGVKNPSKHKRTFTWKWTKGGDSSSRTAALWPKPATLTPLDVAHDTFLPCYLFVCFSQPTPTVTEMNWFFLFCCAFVALPDGPVIWRMLTYPPTRRALLVGCGLHMFQQVSGINTIMWVEADIMGTSLLYQCGFQGITFLHLHMLDTQDLVCKDIWRRTFSCWIVTEEPKLQ